MPFNPTGRNALPLIASLLLTNGALAIAADRNLDEPVPPPATEARSRPMPRSDLPADPGPTRPMVLQGQPPVVYPSQGYVSQWSIAPMPTGRLYGYSTTLYYGHPFYYGPPVYPQPYQYGTYYSPVGGYGHPSAYPAYTGYYGYPPYSGPMVWRFVPRNVMRIPPSPPATTVR